jgi:hypothetical protein
MRFRLLFAFLYLMCSPFYLSAQELSPVALNVERARSNGTQFQKITPFGTSAYQDERVLAFATDGQMLKLHTDVLKNLLTEKPEAISVVLPFHGEQIRIDLVRASVLTEDFTVLTSASNNAPVPFQDGLHYRGYLPNQPNSVAAISFFANDVIGVFATQSRGNMVIGKLQMPNNTRNYILYSENALAKGNDFKCGQEGRIKTDPKVPTVPSSAEVNGCVRVFLEADFQLYTNKGSVSGTVNYLSGVFNVIATLYNNITVSTYVSQIFIWVEDDPYTENDAGAALDEFQVKRTFFNGDLAHLVTLDNQGNGGVAWVGVLCGSLKYAYSEINSTYNSSATPVYSWTTEVMAHEMGHNLDSEHTQNCGWTALVASGGALDNCYATEGGCAPGPAPVGQGTIMSYCHLNGTGINFSNGFGLWNGGTGTQPRNAITTHVSTSPCLSATCAAANPCGAPTALTVTGLVGNSATLAWAAVSGATGYNVQYRVVDSAPWTTLTNVTSPLNLTSLPANVELEIAIQSICGAGTSDFFIGTIITTSSSTCPEPTALASSSVSINSAVLNWTENGTATSWDIFRTTTGTAPAPTVTPTHASVTKPFTTTGLSGQTTYQVYVRSNCAAGVKSAWSAVHNFTTALDCSTLPTLTENTDFLLNIPAGVGVFNMAGVSPNNSCGYNTPGQEAFFKFTPSQTALYVFQSTGGTEYIDYFFKVDDGNCNGSGWTCIDDVQNTARRGVLLNGGITYLFMADLEGTTAESATIRIHRTSTLLNPNSTACNTLTTQGTFSNDGCWYLFGTGSSVAGAIKSTSNLPNLTISFQDNATPLSHNGQFYLPRYFNITSSTPPSGLVDIVLFHRNDELTAYNSSSANSSTTSTLEVSYYDGTNEDCSPSNNVSGTVGTIPITTAFPFSATSFGLHFRTNHFTEFAAAESFVSLPLELLDFKAKALAKSNKIDWKVASQVNVRSHAVEFSSNGTQWQTIHQTNVLSDATEQTYSFEHTNPGALNYYRLRFDEQDGTARYSAILLLERKDKGVQIVQAFPVPADQSLQIKLSSPEEMGAVIEIVNTLGQVVASQYADLSNGTTEINVSVTNLPSGPYRMQVLEQQSQRVLQTLQITVQH